MWTWVYMTLLHSAVTFFWGENISSLRLDYNRILRLIIRSLESLHMSSRLSSFTKCTVPTLWRKQNLRSSLEFTAASALWRVACRDPLSKELAHVNRFHTKQKESETNIFCQGTTITEPSGSVASMLLGTTILCNLKTKTSANVTGRLKQGHCSWCPCFWVQPHCPPGTLFTKLNESQQKQGRKQKGTNEWKCKRNGMKELKHRVIWYMTYECVWFVTWPNWGYQQKKQNIIPQGQAKQRDAKRHLFVRLASFCWSVCLPICVRVWWSASASAWSYDVLC